MITQTQDLCFIIYKQSNASYDLVPLPKIHTINQDKWTNKGNTKENQNDLKRFSREHCNPVFLSSPHSQLHAMVARGESCDYKIMTLISKVN